MERRLAALLMADVVGYSRLIEEDETGTLATLKDRRTSIVEPTVHAHGGRIVKVMGDGVLIEFSSAVNAVTSAMDLQSKMAEANVHLPDSRRIVLRIPEKPAQMADLAVATGPTPEFVECFDLTPVTRHRFLRDPR